MKFALESRGDGSDSTVIYGEIEISQELADRWYDEMMRRFREDEKELFDIDESYECGVISVAHLNAMNNFLFRKNT